MFGALQIITGDDLVISAFFDILHHNDSLFLLEVLEVNREHAVYSSNQALRVLDQVIVITF